LCHRHRAGRIAFWVLIALAVLLALHGALVLGFRLRRRHLPAILEFPRLELFLLLFLIAPIGQIAAREALTSSSIDVLDRLGYLEDSLRFMPDPTEAIPSAR
jgi:hypothetical protein